jgi:ribonuclease HI
MGRREERLLLELIDGVPLGEASRNAGLGLESARAFLASVARFAAAVGEGMEFGTQGTARRAAGGTHAELVIETDGASHGNPGPAGAGVVVMTPDGEVLDELSEHLGVATNNVAEYEAVRLGLARALELGARRVKVRMDSELVARQLQGRYKVKNRGLLEAYLRVEPLIRQLEHVAFVPVPREENARADRLAGEGARRRTASTD